MNNQTIISPIVYYGAKSSLAEWITSFFPKHKTYVEVFGGSGIILIRKEPVPIEVYNDIDNMLSDLFKVLRDESTTEFLRDLCEMTPYSRIEFNESRELSDETLENARRAMVRFNMSYAGNGRTFSTTVQETVLSMPSQVRRWQKRIEALIPAHERLQRIIVENEDFRQLIPRYDTPDTLFYLDPPYHMSTRDGKNRYIHEFRNKDHEDLVDILKSIQGGAVVSGYNCQEYARLESNGYIRHDKESIIRASSVNTKRIESIWVKQPPLTRA